MKWLKKKIWQLCCITFDDDDIIVPPNGENFDLESGYFGLEPMNLGLADDIDKMDFVYNWVMACRADWWDFRKYNGKQSSATYYPSATTCTNTSRAKKTKHEARKLCHQMADVNKDLTLLSKKLDQIAALQKLL